MKKPALILILSVIAAAMTLPGCQLAAAPAVFEVSSLQIKPNQITAGETATVTAVVTNSGSGSGVYNAVLSIDTVRSDSKSVHLEPGASQSISFSLTENTPGTYEVEIGDASAKLTVKPKLVAKQTTLKYDGGFAKDYLALEKPATGYLVSFVPPSTEFVIQSISLMGLVFGSKGVQIRDLEVEIWDASLKVLYSSTLDWKKFPQLTYLLSLDLQSKGDWVELPVPDVRVDGNFYVHIYAGPNIGPGFRMGADNSVINAHSDLTIRDEGGGDSILAIWPYAASQWFGDKKSVNWMVRVSGSAMVPE